MEIEEALGGGPVPDQFVYGQVGRSTVYHTLVCDRVETALKNTQRDGSDPKPRIKEISDDRIEYHDLNHCSGCQRKETVMGDDDGDA
mgnify:CR=1 FL=1